MKTYSVEERTEAKKKLPRPVLDFLLSPTISNIYVGMQKKHNLDFRQLVLFCDVTNLTLMGLEPQSALETNLHQAMHELSNEGTRELVADTNDRVFKEAQRRLRENISEPSIWSEEITAPESPEQKAKFTELERVKNMEDDDSRLQELYKKDEKAELVRKAAEDEEDKKVEEEYEKRHAEAEKITIEAQNVELAPQDTTSAEPLSGIQLIEKGQMAGTRDVREMEEAPTDVHASSDSASISTQKLGETTVATAQEVQVGESEYPVSSMKYQGKSKPEQARPRDGMDPYRETPE